MYTCRVLNPYLALERSLELRLKEEKYKIMPGFSFTQSPSESINDSKPLATQLSLAEIVSFNLAPRAYETTDWKIFKNEDPTEIAMVINGAPLLLPQQASCHLPCGV